MLNTIRNGAYFQVFIFLLFTLSIYIVQKKTMKQTQILQKNDDIKKMKWIMIQFWICIEYEKLQYGILFIVNGQNSMRKSNYA